MSARLASVAGTPTEARERVDGRWARGGAGMSRGHCNKAAAVPFLGRGLHREGFSGD
jgi:hypothetical protein